jgi:LPPG:FO 2-phospho-L-lactate transferase
MITVLAGGVGAARFLEGLAAVVPPEEITVIVNTGDDAQFHGLHISPDLDTVLYTLAGLVSRETGWGIEGDSFYALSALQRLGVETWFRLGDQDLATHLYRTRRLRESASLSLVTQELCRRFGVLTRLVPMSDDPAPTRVQTPEGNLPLQEYFVKLKQEPEVLRVDLSAAALAHPAEGVTESIMRTDGVIFAPSNPFISIGPILSVQGIREAIRNTPAPVAAISPIVGGKALKGPAARMMRSLGLTASAAAVAEYYKDFLDVFVMDVQDAELAPGIEASGLKTVVTSTVMDSAEAKKNLARATIEAMQEVRYSPGGAGKER